jgi:hypothetical protein
MKSLHPSVSAWSSRRGTSFAIMAGMTTAVVAGNTVVLKPAGTSPSSPQVRE